MLSKKRVGGGGEKHPHVGPTCTNIYQMPSKGCNLKFISKIALGLCRSNSPVPLSRSNSALRPSKMCGSAVSQRPQDTAIMSWETCTNMNKNKTLKIRHDSSNCNPKKRQPNNPQTKSAKVSATAGKEMAQPFKMYTNRLARKHIHC